MRYTTIHAIAIIPMILKLRDASAENCGPVIVLATFKIPKTATSTTAKAAATPMIYVIPFMRLLYTIQDIAAAYTCEGARCYYILSGLCRHPTSPPYKTSRSGERSVFVTRIDSMGKTGRYAMD